MVCRYVYCVGCKAKSMHLFQVPLPGYIENIKEKLAENLHELWALGKIENGWIWGEVSHDFVASSLTLMSVNGTLVSSLISSIVGGYFCCRFFSECDVSHFIG